MLELWTVTGMPGGPTRTAALHEAERIAGDRREASDMRADAIRLLSLSSPQQYATVLRQALDPQEPATVQKAAVRAMGQIEGGDIGRFLLSNWSTMTPDIRDEAVDALMTEPARVQLLLDAIEARTVQTSTIGWRRSVRLMQNRDERLREQARALLGEQPGSREEVVEQYQAALTTRGNPERGRQVFSAACATCHQIDGEDGTAFGPDLSTVRHWSPHALLSKILAPNRSIADGYELWMVERRGGDSVVGVIAAQLPTSITLRNAGEQEATIPRADIESITALNVSAMPAGLERQINERQMADLLAFLRSYR
jgi:putative heme-binding domain-containing protein